MIDRWKITISCPFCEILMDYLLLIYNKSLFNINFQFVCWLVVTTSFSSKWRRHEKWWCHENALYINFSTYSNFLMCYFDSEKQLYVCRKLALIWDNFRVFAISSRQKSLSHKKLGNIYYFILICNTSSLAHKNAVENTPLHLTLLQKLIKFEFLSSLPKLSWNNDDVIKKSRDLAHSF